MGVLGIGLFFPSLYHFVQCREPPPLYWGAAVDGYPVSPGRLDQVAGEMGFSLDIVLFYLQWPASGFALDFPENSLNAVWAKGALPCISWEPFFIENGKETTIMAYQITRGEYDPYIRNFARRCAGWGQPVILRFAHEMNIQRYHWGTSEETYGPESPKIYREMYRYVADLFKREKAFNVLWTFCPNSECLPNPSFDPTAGWNRISAWFPKKEQVDILGMDGYNWGTTQIPEKHGWQSSWRSFAHIFEPAFRELKHLAPDKPLMVFETACATRGGDKAQWLKNAKATAEKWNLSAIVWFQVNKEIDWRIGSGVSNIPPNWGGNPGGVSVQQWALELVEAKKR